MVDFSFDGEGYTDVKPGEKENTVVDNITPGKQKDFRTDAYWEKVESTKEDIEKMKETAAVLVETKNGATIVINLPPGKKVSPKSNLSAWKRTYSKYPFIGQEVVTKVDENGFNRIVLEK